DTWNYLGVFAGYVSATVGNVNGAFAITINPSTYLTVLGQSLNLAGSITPTSFDLKGSMSVNVGSLHLANANFELNTGGFTFNAGLDFLGVFTGTINATVGVSNGASYITINDPTNLSVFGKPLSLSGYIAPTSFDLKGNVDVTVGPFVLTKAC